ncbi:MAG: DUF72 domain-containing protein [Polyangia bacterium]
MARIRVGTGGWTYEPWRGTFYPKGPKRPKALPQKQELAYAASQLSAIEINATFHRDQARSSFVRWHDETPDDFVFTVKASRFATNRKDLAAEVTGASVDRFLATGLDALGDKLGPILWQLAPTKTFAADELDAFLARLPRKLGKRRLQHALEPRHASFDTPALTKLAKKHGVAIVFTDSLEYPSIDAHTADFSYARLVRCDAKKVTGYGPRELDAWATRAEIWSRRGDAFVFFINGAKERAPFAALALRARLGS